MKKFLIVSGLAVLALFVTLWKLIPQEPQNDSAAQQDDSSKVLKPSEITSSPNDQNEPGSSPRNSTSKNPKPLPHHLEEMSPAERRASKLLSLRPQKGDSERHSIKNLLSETWLTPESEPTRHRVRIIETAEFKHPYLRLEEMVTTDKDTGEVRIQTIKNSVADHITVGLKKGLNPETVAKALEAEGYTIRRASSNFLLVEITNFNNASAHEKAVKEFETFTKFTKFAESDNLRYTAVTPNDPQFSDMYGLNNTGQTGGTIDADINAPEGWNQRTDASTIVVAVTDTGINYLHEDLASNMWQQPITGHFGINAVEDNNDPMDDNGHGTHVAGTIGAQGNNGVGTTGVAWNVQLMACRGLGNFGGTTADLADVINFARTNDADVINASWGGGGPSSLMFDAIQACYDDGMIFLAAAGNDSTDNDVGAHYPSNYAIDGIISVASIDHKNNLSSFSNFGQTSVDIAAPGTDILSTWIGGTDQYKTISGTSMACPHACGVMAMIYAEFPTYTVEEKMILLYTTASPMPNLGGLMVYPARVNLRDAFYGIQPPANDDIENALVWNERTHSWGGQLSLATRQTGEDGFSHPDTGNHSVWFEYTAPENGPCFLQARSDGNSLNYVLYKGAGRGSLVRLADNIDENPTSARSHHQHVFNAVKNTTYYIVLDTSYDGYSGASLSLTLPPKNNNIAQATTVSGSSFAASGLNDLATSQYFEKTAGEDAQSHAHGDVGTGYSVWWEWKASFTGDMNFTATAATPGLGLVTAIYTGDWFENDGSWVSVSPPDDPSSDQTVQVTKDTTYYIAVDSITDDTGVFSFGGLQISSYSSFAVTQFTAAELEDDSISAATADADADGKLNWIEFIHGSNPKDADENGILSMGVSANKSNNSTDVASASAEAMLTATFTRNRSASGSVHAETSVDMENWTDSNVTETVLYLNGNIETIRATAETGNSQQSFIRLKYTQ